MLGALIERLPTRVAQFVLPRITVNIIATMLQQPGIEKILTHLGARADSVVLHCCSIHPVQDVADD